MIKTSKRLNNIIFILFTLFILANQFAIYTTFRFISYFSFAMMLGLICVSFFHDKKKIYEQSINFQNIIFFLISLFLIYYYFQNQGNFNLKMFVYLIIVLLISNLIYQKNNLVVILNITLLVAGLLLIIGLIGWFYGGEGGTWGDQFIYFGYRYTPSTRNQDCQIFLLAYIITLFFIFSEKNIKIYLTLNSLFSAALLLSYSRGYWLIYIVIFLFALLMNIFFRYIKTRKFLKIYLLNIIFIIAIIFSLNTLLKLTNSNTQLTLQNQFFIKISSVLKFSEIGTNEIDINNLNNNTLSHLEATSIMSWQQKSGEFQSLLKIKNYENLFKSQHQEKYYESGIIFILVNYPVIFFLFTIYFANQLYYIFTTKEEHKKKYIFNIIFLISFIYLNTIYNLVQDSVNYLYFLLVILFKKLLFHKYTSKRLYNNVK